MLRKKHDLYMNNLVGGVKASIGLSMTKNTVNSEIFARVLFSRNFAYAEFRENISFVKW